jgi:hypothetical protein
MWQVEHQCTQCGADVLLDEEQRFFRCPFCRVNLYISPDGFFRYYLAPGPGSGASIFVPYWRFKGMAFSFRNAEVACRIVDVSRNATRFDFLPRSLGIRSQTQKLRFLSPAVPGSFLEHDAALEDSLALEEKFVQAGMVRPKMTYIGESMSMIYFPVYYRDLSVYDGLAGERIAPMPDEAGLDFAGRPQAGEGRLSFIPCLCPDCGSDMEGGPHSAVLTCGNCFSAWAAAGGALEKVPCSFVPARGDSLEYLPFWRIEGGAAWVLETRADAVRLLNLPVGVRPEWEREPFASFVPAFKINPEWFLKIAKVMSFCPGPFSLEEGSPKGRLFPATLPLGEALESLTMILAYSAADRKGFARYFPDLKFVQGDARLVWWPFIPSGMELVRPDREFSISASMLKWGKGI